MMQSKTKITLSDKELLMVQDSSWILTKQTIIQKVCDLFAGNIPVIQSEFMGSYVIPSQARSSLPKIFKGENYLELPYVILDYPRCFMKDNIFAVRTMFWWGNFFSITLHVSGIHKKCVRQILYNDNLDLQDELFVGINKDQWQHHFENDNYVAVRGMSLSQRIRQYEESDFIKLALKYELNKWNEMQELLEAGYSKIASILFNSPNDGKVL